MITKRYSPFFGYRIIFLLTIVLLSMGCKRDPEPRKAIPREQYVDILVDVHLAEAMYRDRERLKIDSLESTPLYLATLKKHRVTEKQMLITTQYYIRNPKVYDKIYGEVISKISLMIEDENTNKEVILNPK